MSNEYINEYTEMNEYSKFQNTEIKYWDRHIIIIAML